MKLTGLSFLKIILFLGVTLGCAKNVFKDSASTDSDASLLVDAKVAINSFDYQTAITIITTKMTTVGQAQTSSKEVLASAYAGQCGLNFVSYLDGLSNAPGGSSAFKLMMLPFVGIAGAPDLCLTALNTLSTIGTTAQRTSNENAFAAVIGMSLVGSQIKTTVDLLPAAGNGNGVIDGNVCNLTNAQMDNIILGLGHMIQNFSYLTVAQTGSGSQTAINNFVTACAASVGSSCAVTDPTQITQPLRDVMKDFLNTADYGVGAVVLDGNPATLLGACP